jgi:hypothetical protein
VTLNTPSGKPRNESSTTTGDADEYSVVERMAILTEHYRLGLMDKATERRFRRLCERILADDR